MATTAATPAATIPGEVRNRRISPGTGRTFDTLMWQFMRISGAALIPLALGHLGIMHLINNVHMQDACFVYVRWSNLLWRVYDAGLLGFALIHGLNGVRYSVDDYIHNPALNNILRGAIVIVGTVIFLAGAIALIGGVRINELQAPLTGCPGA